MINNLLTIMTLFLANLWFSTLWAAEPSAETPGQESRVDENPSATGSESLEELDEYEESIAPEVLAKELLPESYELRRQFEQGVQLGLGVSKPWQNLHVEYQSRLRPELWLGISYGLGTASFSGKNSGRDYELSTDSQQISASLRYFFTESIPVYVSGLFGYGTWSGKIKATGVDINEENAILDNISTTFNAQGFTLGLGLGCAALWENGFYLDYTFVGIAVSKLSHESLARNRDRARKILEHSLEEPIGYGFLNIAAGYFF